MIHTLAKINTTAPPGHAIATDICQAHAAIAAMFPNTPIGASGPGRILYAQPHPGRLLIQSHTQPDLRWLPPGTITTIETRPAQTAYPPGTRLRWSAAVNPVKTHRAYIGGVHGPSKMVPIRGHTAIVDWAIQRLHGATRITAQIIETRLVTGIRASGQKVTLHYARLVGECTVNRPDLWGNLLASGFGHGKAYGCGLVVCEVLH